MRGRAWRNFMKSKFFCALVTSLALVGSTTFAGATVVTFDDLTGRGVLTNGYGGITWNGQWGYYDGTQSPFNPESGLERIYSAPQIANTAFTFAARVTFQGAYVAGDPDSVNFELYLAGSLVATSASLIASNFSAFLSSGYLGSVDMVVVHEAGYNGAIGRYVLDNITYSEATTPLPAALPMFASGLGVLGLLGWYRKKNARTVAV